MSGKICTMLGCYNYSMVNLSKTFHRFPRNFEQCKQWVICTKQKYLEAVLDEKGAIKLNTSYSICSDHFRDEDYINPLNKSQGLKKQTLPSLNLPQDSKKLLQQASKRKWDDTDASTSSSVQRNYNEDPFGRCSVLDCQFKVRPKHRFPNPKYRMTLFKRWIEVCGNPKFENMDPYSIHRSYRVCHAHFRAEDRATYQSLQKYVIPRLFVPPNEIEYIWGEDTIIPKIEFCDVNQTFDVKSETEDDDEISVVYKVWSPT